MKKKGERKHQISRRFNLGGYLSLIQEKKEITRA